MQAINLKDVKAGDYFSLKDSENAPMWVRGEYDRSTKKYSITKFDDMNRESLKAGSVVVYVGHTF